MTITDNVEDVRKLESMVLPRPCRYDDLTRGEGNFTTPPTSRKIVSGSTLPRKDLGVRTTSIKAARRLGDFEVNEGGWASERVVDAAPQGEEVGEFNHSGDEKARLGRQPKRGQDRSQRAGQMVEQGARQSRTQNRVVQGVEQGSIGVSGGRAVPGLVPWGSSGVETRARVTQQVAGV